MLAKYSNDEEHTRWIERPQNAAKAVNMIPTIPALIIVAGQDVMLPWALYCLLVSYDNKATYE